eukprot:TRINITY_DN107850_c0_g1_i1.p1 TRINITY_DN107850_c0_g1~~TRINITY_DN107850_c0_g1_i1.p1  ORF type:complete len:174 (+),score=24.29 TRINITY_DN107850_c0_g1_i1:16-537(+)
MSELTWLPVELLVPCLIAMIMICFLQRLTCIAMLCWAFLFRSWQRWQEALPASESPEEVVMFGLVMWLDLQALTPDNDPVSHRASAGNGSNCCPWRLFFFCCSRPAPSDPDGDTLDSCAQHVITGQKPASGDDTNAEVSISFHLHLGVAFFACRCSYWRPSGCSSCAVNNPYC